MPRTDGILPQLLGSTAHDASVIFASSGNAGELSTRLYQVAGTGPAQPLAELATDAAPGGDRDPGAGGIIGRSPDGTILAYGGNVLGGDTGAPSDSVTVVNLRTLVPATFDLPRDDAQPLRICSVWVDSSNQVYASAWHQPGNGGGTVPDTPVTPQVYRLTDGHWVDTGASALSDSGGAHDWTAVITTSSGTLTPYKETAAGNLVATTGHTRISLATGVTAYAWAPAQ